jgi:hypothetical protein
MRDPAKPHLGRNTAMSKGLCWESVPREEPKNLACQGIDEPNKSHCPHKQKHYAAGAQNCNQYSTKWRGALREARPYRRHLLVSVLVTDVRLLCGRARTGPLLLRGPTCVERAAR